MKQSFSTYARGFGLSVILTLAAYFAVVEHWFAGWAIVAVITALAVCQLAVQLVFFLHLGSESKPRWNVYSFVFMVLMVLTIVIGSIWIMYNLDYHTMSPAETDKAIVEDEGISQ